jgi:hypothetical protein
MKTIALLLAAATGASSLPQPSPALLTTTEINQIVGAVLTHADVAQFLHPDMPGRLPVKVTVAAPYSGAQLNLVLYRRPVVVVAEGTDAVNFAIARTSNGAKAEISFRPEGMEGTVLLLKVQNRWIASSVSVSEY